MLTKLLQQILQMISSLLVPDDCGSSGTAGATGATGPAGPTGATGATGPAA